MESKNTHRRCRSEGTAQWDSLQPNFNAQGIDYSGAAELRTVSFDTSASQFLQSLALHDARAYHSQLPSLGAEAAALGDTHCITAGHAATPPAYAAAQSKPDAWPGPAEVTTSAGTKRLHDSSKSRGSKDVFQQEGKKDAPHQHKHSFTPALPAVEEMTGEDAGLDDRDDDDEDYDSDRDEYPNPTSRRSSGSRFRAARRGGYNGRSENELLLLDPKRVKRILANRQSAARSKERRLNYTMQLEGKLQGLSQEVDKLTACLDSLQGQGKGLLQARAELEQQVKALQAQLSQTTSENEALMNELFGLQQSLGLPQVLPQSGAACEHNIEGQHSAAVVAGTAAQMQYDLSAEASCGAQEQHRHHQQYVHWQQHNSAAEHNDLHPGPTAVAALHVPKSKVQHQEHQQQHGHRSSKSFIGYQPASEGTEAGRFLSNSAAAVNSAAGAGVVPGCSMPPLPPNGKPASFQAPGANITKTGSGGVPGQPASPRAASPYAGLAVPPPAFSPVLSAAATAANNLSCEAAAAADVLLLDASIGVDDTAMTNADDLEMLSVLFDDPPMQDSGGVSTAAAARQQDPLELDFSSHQLQQHTGQVGSAAMQPLNMQSHQPSTDQPGLMQSAIAAAAAPSATAQAARYSGSLPSYRRPAGLTTLGPSNSNPNLHQQQSSALTPGHLRTWSAQSSPVGTSTAGGAAGNTMLGFDRPASGAPNPGLSYHLNPSNTGLLNPYSRSLRSPAFSDPLAEGYPDDVSSGSLGGCPTPSTCHHRMSDGSSVAAGGALRQQGLPAAGLWQQQQMVPAVSPPAPGGAETAPADAAGVGSHPAGVSALMPPAVHAAAAATAAMAQYGAPSSYQIQQQQQQQFAAGEFFSSTTAAAAAVSDPAQVNFTMGVNPAAGHRRSASYGAPAPHHHHRSASAGSMTGMSWAEVAAAAAADRSGLHWSVQSCGPLTGSTGGLGYAGAGGLVVGPGMRPVSPFQQQQYTTGGISNMAAAGLGYHRAGRASAPGYPAQGSILADAASDAVAAGSSGSERWAQVTGHDIQGSSTNHSQQQHHRRSYSHAGTYAAAPFAAGASSSFEQVQQVGRIHPAALGPGASAAAAAATLTAAQAATLPVFHGGYLGGPGGGPAPEVYALDMHTRRVTTSNNMGHSR